MKRRGWYKDVAYPRVEDFAWVELEIPAGKAKDLVALAEKLEGLPRIAEAFAAGEIDWTKARTIARVATAADEDAWLYEARSSTNRGLERNRAPLPPLTPSAARAEPRRGDAALSAARA